MKSELRKLSISSWALGGLIAVVLGFTLVGEGRADASHSAQRSSSFCDVDKAGLDVTDAKRQAILVLNKEHVVPGGLVFGRVVNLASEPIGYGYEFSIERFLDGHWMTDPASPDGPWLKVRGRLAPGSVGRCYRFAVPPDQPTGRYRLSTRVVRLGTNSKGQIRLSGVFVIR